MIQGDIQKMMHPHYFLDILLCSLFFVTKHISPICNYFYSSTSSIKNNFNPCIMDWREKEILLFLGICITFKVKRETNYISAFKTITRFIKIASIALLIRSGPSAIVLTAIYIITCVCQFLYMPQPAINLNKRNNNIPFVFEPADLRIEMENLKSNLLKPSVHQNSQSTNTKDTIWVIYYWASWSPECKKFSPIFNKIANKYSISESTCLNFGTLDVSNINDELPLAYFDIDSSKISEQIPSIVLYINGVEKIRRPSYEDNYGT
ncbi:unnamed protein product [Gordionus sp. m RMFG-2023]